MEWPFHLRGEWGESKHAQDMRKTPLDVRMQSNPRAVPWFFLPVAIPIQVSADSRNKKGMHFESLGYNYYVIESPLGKKFLWKMCGVVSRNDSIRTAY